MSEQPEIGKAAISDEGSDSDQSKGGYNRPRGDANDSDIVASSPDVSSIKSNARKIKSDKHRAKLEQRMQVQMQKKQVCPARHTLSFLTLCAAKASQRPFEKEGKGRKQTEASPGIC